MASDEINTIREQIDKLDAEIVRLLNERADRALDIGSIKRRDGIPIYSPEREEQVLAMVKEANQGKLTDDAIRRLFERIIDESRRLERETNAGEE